MAEIVNFNSPFTAAGALSVVAGSVAATEADMEGVGVADGFVVTTGVTVVSELEIII